MIYDTMFVLGYVNGWRISQLCIWVRRCSEYLEVCVCVSWLSLHVYWWDTGWEAVNDYVT